jgi:histone deacetylase 11
MLASKLTPKSLPIIYRPENNITFLGLQKLHPFDPEKYSHIVENLVKNKIIQESQLIQQNIVSREQLLTIHTEEYLDSLSWSSTIAKVCEFPPMAFVPNFLLQWKVMTPMWYQVGATILGGEIARKYGWTICLSGGMHHASSDSGGGWCAFSDIPISIKSLMSKNLIKTAMIIDLDAHQGNGHERDKMNGKICSNVNDVYIFDVYNKNAYPGDRDAKRGIDIDEGITRSCDDKKYLSIVENGLKKAFTDFKADIVYYNAGTDILDSDPIGHLSITAKGIIERDHLVFKACIERNIPIVMVLSGGYAKENAKVISDSIESLFTTCDLVKVAQENYEKNKEIEIEMKK